MPQTTQNKVGVWLPNAVGLKWSSFYPNGDRPALTGWKIAKAQQYGQKMAMYGVYPRPSGEVGANAPHLWAHSTMPYVIKPGVLGGCWPFRWSVTTGPASNFTVGSELLKTSQDSLFKFTVDANYQKYTWSGTKSGSQSMSLRCTDQLDNVVDFNYTVTVDDTKFVFVDVNAANDSGTGTIGSPKKFFSSVWNSSNAGKIVVLRGGNHTLSDAISSSVVEFSTTRPIGLMAYPGETVNLNCSTHIFTDNGPANDLLVRDLNLTNIERRANTWAMVFSARQQRVTLDNIKFGGLLSGTVGDNNQAAIVFFDSGTAHNNIFCVDCKLDPGCEVSMFINFNMQYLLIERPYATGISQPFANGVGFVNVKDNSDHVTIRGTFFNGSTAGEAPIKISNQTTPGTYQENCWYTVIAPDGGGVHWNQQRFTAGGGPLFDYAGQVKAVNNSCINASYWSPSNVKVTIEGLTGYGQDGLIFDSGSQAGAISNQLLTSAEIDSTTGQLISTGTAYRLTKGSELWSNV